MYSPENITYFAHRLKLNFFDFFPFSRIEQDRDPRGSGVQLNHVRLKVPSLYPLRQIHLRPTVPLQVHHPSPKCRLRQCR